MKDVFGTETGKYPIPVELPLLVTKRAKDMIRLEMSLS